MSKLNQLFTKSSLFDKTSIIFGFDGDPPASVWLQIFNVGNKQTLGFPILQHTYQTWRYLWNHCFLERFVNTSRKFLDCGCSCATFYMKQSANLSKYK